MQSEKRLGLITKIKMSMAKWFFYIRKHESVVKINGDALDPCFLFSEDKINFWFNEW